MVHESASTNATSVQQVCNKWLGGTPPGAMTSWHSDSKMDVIELKRLGESSFASAIDRSACVLLHQNGEHVLNLFVPISGEVMSKQDSAGYIPVRTWKARCSQWIPPLRTQSDFNIIIFIMQFRFFYNNFKFLQEVEHVRPVYSRYPCQKR